MKKLPILLCFITSLLLVVACKEAKVNNKDEVLVETVDTIQPKLFLLSKGLTTDTLRKAFLDFLEVEPEILSVAIVVNASSTEKKKRKKAKKIKVEFDEIGFDSTKMELFDLMKTKPHQLLEFDVVYILGGNPFLLLDEVNKSDARPVFKELADQGKTLMGYSAGALLLGPDLSLMNHVDTLLGFNEIGLKELSCIGLYDFHIFPHYTDFTNEVPELITKIEQYKLESDLPVYKLNDNQAIVYEHGVVTMIGK